MYIYGEHNTMPRKIEMSCICCNLKIYLDYYPPYLEESCLGQNHCTGKQDKLLSCFSNEKPNFEGKMKEKKMRERDIDVYFSKPKKERGFCSLSNIYISSGYPIDGKHLS